MKRTILMLFVFIAIFFTAETTFSNGTSLILAVLITIVVDFTYTDLVKHEDN